MHLDPSLTAELVGKDLIAFGTGFMGKLVIPYLSQEMYIKIHGVTNSRVAEEDAGTFMDTRLPIRSLAAWAERMPDATILLCVVKENFASAWAACEAAGFQKIMIVPFYLVEMLLDLCNPRRMPTAHPSLHMMCLANEIRDLHKAAFEEFKGCHRGQTVAVVATGPTLNHYSQIKGVPHVGTNSSFLKKGLELDYYFLRHYDREWCDELKNYSFLKFFARNEWAERDRGYDRFPEYVIEENNGRRFFTSEPNNEIYEDITYYPLMGGYSIIFQALQFAMYTRPKRLLLIGCDCSYDGHYDGNSTPMGNENVHLTADIYVPRWIEGYKKIKVFAEQYYPDMEIMSVNPVGLRGMFHDMYTESYLAAHLELKQLNCEILDTEKLEREG